MASNIKPRQRAFALTIALIFLVTTLATSVFVVMAIIQDSKKKDPVDITQTDKATSEADSAKCAIDSVTGQATLPVPEVFKPTGDVTALATTDLEPGTGATIKAGDCIIAKYYGTLATSGEKFDENFTSDGGLVLQVGVGSVIPGWDEGIVGMKVGGTRRLVIPSDKAYGEQGSGAIPANADLVFVVKVTEVKK
jgi:peptidylprolyl isomerase